jgi:hypothetical protein
MNNGDKLPQDGDAEKGLIGSMMLSTSTAVDGAIQYGVSESDFHHPRNRALWRLLVQMRMEHRPVDLITTSDAAEKAGIVQEIGGHAYITELFSFVPTGSNWKYYAEIIREKALARRVIAFSKQLIADASNPAQHRNLPAKVQAALSSVTLVEPKEADLFIDLQKIIDSGLEPERPTVAEILPGKYLLYAGRLNEIHAEPSIGKTNIALSAAISVMSNGGHVLFIDPEDTAVGTLNRLITFGVNPSWILEGFHYLHNPTPEEFERAISWAAKHNPALVCLDGLAEAMTAEGKNEDLPMDVLPFLRHRLRPFAEQGSAVLISDHVTKSAETRGRWARGSGAKLGRYDGAVYSAELVEPYSPTVAGRVRLRVSKDRNGGIGVAGQVVAEINFTPQEGKTLVTFQEPAEAKAFKPTAIMAKICERLKLFPDSSKRDLLRLGAHEWVEEAITHLVKDGFLSAIRQGQRMKYTLLKTYSGN